jgi:hypothetical protein
VVIGTDCIGSNNDEYTVYTDIFNIIPSYIRIPSGKNNKIYIYFSSTGDFKERSLGVPMFTDVVWSNLSLRTASTMNPLVDVVWNNQ